MARCDYCGEHESMPYNCRYCGGQFCSTHRLPENHECHGLDEFEDQRGVFHSGFDDSIAPEKSKDSIAARIGIDPGSGGVMGYFRGNMTYVFLLAMWVTLLGQWFVLILSGRDLHNAIFVLSSEHPEYVWTWITSIFAHDPFGFLHIVFNSIVIFFFGPLVERYIGSRNFGLLFIVSGVIAGLSQISLDIIDGVPGEPAGVLGASGAALAILGVLTVFNPNLRVYFFGIVPMALWILTAGVAVFSLAVILIGQPAFGGIAHMAHLVGLLVGLAYGLYIVRTTDFRPPRQFQIGGGGPPHGRRRR